MVKKTTKAIESQKPALPEPDKREKEEIAKAKQDLLKRKPPIEVKITSSLKDGNEQKTVDCPHTDAAGWSVRFLNALGTRSISFINETMNNLQKATSSNVSTPLTEQAYNSALAVLDSMQPQNELEAMLITQMIATHNLAMQQLGLLKRTEHADHAQIASNAATKLLRTYTAQMETLNKMRRGGEQHVRVEHVHVHQGGQAIVGNVTQHKHTGGGGDATQNRTQAYEPKDATALALDGSTEMWSENPQREAMPVPRSEE